MTLDLDAIQARADAATRGPWKYREKFYTEEAERGCEVGEDNYAVPQMVARTNRGRGDSGRADAEFIAHAREDVPALVAALRRVLDNHPRGSTWYIPGEGLVTTDDDRIEDGCLSCAIPWPCPDVTAILGPTSASKETG